MRKRCLMILGFILLFSQAIQAENELYRIVEDRVYRYSDEAITIPNYLTTTNTGVCADRSEYFDLIPLNLRHTTYFSSHSVSRGTANFKLVLDAVFYGSDERTNIINWKGTSFHPVQNYGPVIAEIEIPSEYQIPTTQFFWTATVPAPRSSVSGIIEIVDYYLYDENLYPIDFVLNGGEVSELPSVYDTNTELNLPLATKEGYQFVGWCLNEDLSDEAILTQSAGQSGRKTYYAKYKEASSGFSLRFPKSIDLNEATSFEYAIKGSLNEDEALSIHVGTLEMENAYKGKKTLSVSLEKSTFINSELTEEYAYYKATIDGLLSAGSWNGTFFVEVKIE